MWYLHLDTYLLSLHMKCISTPWGWPFEGWNMEECKGKVIPLQAWCGPEGTRRGWVVSSTTRPHFTPWKDTVSVLKEAGWAPGPVWTGRKFRPHRDSIPDRPTRSQSLYRQSYPANMQGCNSANNVVLTHRPISAVVGFLNQKNSVTVLFPLHKQEYCYRCEVGWDNMIMAVDNKDQSSQPFLAKVLNMS